MKSGSPNLLEPSGPVQACNGIALPLLLKYVWAHFCKIIDCSQSRCLQERLCRCLPTSTSDEGNSRNLTFCLRHCTTYKLEKANNTLCNTQLYSFGPFGTLMSCNFYTVRQV